MDIYRQTDFTEMLNRAMEICMASLFDTNEIHFSRPRDSPDQIDSCYN